LIGPTKAEREIRLPTGDYFVERSLKQAFSCKPVMVIAKSFHSGISGHFCLCFSDFRHPQIVITEIRR
jgi:hypothetical protein